MVILYIVTYFVFTITQGGRYSLIIILEKREWNKLFKYFFFPKWMKNKRITGILNQDALIKNLCSFPTRYAHFLFSGFLQSGTASQSLVLKQNKTKQNRVLVILLLALILIVHTYTQTNIVSCICSYNWGQFKVLL